MKKGDILMWVITVYSNSNNITMLEFEAEMEAREVYKKISGCKVLTEVVYFNDTNVSLVTI